jgi:hypothetical protein
LNSIDCLATTGGPRPFSPVKMRFVAHQILANVFAKTRL